MYSTYQRLMKRMREEEAGITALETAIILIAFVVVASVFAFTMLSAGTFSTERGKEAIYAGLNEVQSSVVLRGGIIAEATASTETVTGTVNTLVFSLANAAAGLPVNFNNADAARPVFELRTSDARVAVEAGGADGWDVQFLNVIGTDNGMLDYGELAEITVNVPSTMTIGTSTTFVLEIRPPSGAVLNLQRTTPAWLEAINDLK